MATGTARLGREKTLAGLAKALFIFEGRIPAAMRRRVERALLAANPRLARPEGFVAGMTIIVPAIKGLRFSDRVKVSSTDLGGLLGETTTRLRTGAALVSDGVKQAARHARETEARLSDPKFQETAKAALPDSLKLIEQSRKAVTEAQSDISKRGERFEKAFSQAMTEIDRLSKLAKGPHAPKIKGAE